MNYGDSPKVSFLSNLFSLLFRKLSFDFRFLLKITYKKFVPVLIVKSKFDHTRWIHRTPGASSEYVNVVI